MVPIPLNPNRFHWSPHAVIALSRSTSPRGPACLLPKAGLHGEEDGQGAGHVEHMVSKAQSPKLPYVRCFRPFNEFPLSSQPGPP